MINEDIWKLREIVRKLESLESQISKIASFLEEHIDNENVTEEMVRYFDGPVDELERRVQDMMQDVEYMKEQE